MLTNFIKVTFVILAMLVGWVSGQPIYQSFFGQATPSWVGIPVGFSLAITLLAAEQAFRRHFNRSLVAFIIGLSLGLALSSLLLSVMEAAIQDPAIRHNLDLPLTLVCTYLVLITVVRHADRFRVIIPFIEFQSARTEHGRLVIDSSILRDSRALGLLRSGLLGQRIILHQHVIRMIELDALSEEPAQQAKGKRALDTLNELRRLPHLELVTDDTDIPTAQNTEQLLIGLARLEGARLLCNNAELTRLAHAEDITVIAINDLAHALITPLQTGETIRILVERKGDNKDQGIGQLDDGSLVIIDNAADAVGKEIDICILRFHTSSNGKMVFAERDEQSVKQINNEPTSST